MVFSWSGTHMAGMVDRCLQWWHHCPLYQHTKGRLYIFRALGFITTIPRRASLHLVHFFFELILLLLLRGGLATAEEQASGGVYLYGPCLLDMGLRRRCEHCDGEQGRRKKASQKHHTKEARVKSVLGGDWQHWHAKRKTSAAVVMGERQASAAPRPCFVGLWTEGHRRRAEKERHGLIPMTYCGPTNLLLFGNLEKKSKKSSKTVQTLPKTIITSLLKYLTSLQPVQL